LRDSVDVDTVTFLCEVFTAVLQLSERKKRKLLVVVLVTERRSGFGLLISYWFSKSFGFRSFSIMNAVL
jgi:hypothetical protein